MSKLLKYLQTGGSNIAKDSLGRTYTKNDQGNYNLKNSTQEFFYNQNSKKFIPYDEKQLSVINENFKDYDIEGAFKHPSHEMQYKPINKEKAVSLAFMNKKYGNPNLRKVDTKYHPSDFEASDYLTGFSQHYDNITNTISLRNNEIDSYLRELPHAAQEQLIPYSNLRVLKEKLLNKDPYSIKGTIENTAHSVIEPNLRKEYASLTGIKQTGGVAKDNTTVSKTRINEFDKQRINNNYLKSLVDKSRTNVGSQSNVSQRVKNVFARKEADDNINNKQNILNTTALALAPVPVIGEVFGAGNMIAQGVTDAYQGEYGNVALSAIPYGVSKLSKYVKPVKNSINENYLNVSQAEMVELKSKRLLQQKNKFVDQNWENKDYDLEEKLKNANTNHHYVNSSEVGSTPSGLGINKGGKSYVFKDAALKGVPLNDSQKALTASHEVGHYYRNGIEEGKEWLSHFDAPKLTTYLKGRGLKYADRTNMIGTDARPIYSYGDEIRERAGQLKDYIQLKNNIKGNFKITGNQLDDALNNYVKDTGLNNDMSALFGNLKNKKGLLKTMNKFALGTTGAVIANDKFQTGGEMQNEILAEKGEVFKRIDGKILKVSNNAPTHDDGVITDSIGSKFKKASYNNGGVEIPDVESVLSSTHENRNSKDKSYTEVDEVIKVKPDELKYLASSFNLSVKTNKSVSPSKAFELLKASKEEQLKKLNKFQIKNSSTALEKTSFEENSKQINRLPEDDDLYQKLLRMQEFKKQLL